MRIRCPHCHQRIEIVENDPLVEVDCPSCGTSFGLVATSRDTTQASETRRIGHFELLELLGVGAFGSVWKARDEELGRDVAVKLPRKEQLATSEVEKFLREARAAAELRHPNVVSIHEVGREPSGQIYLVSDFIQGATLAEWVKSRPPTLQTSVDLATKIAAGIQHAHERGVIHRDLKPQNILIDLHGQPHIADFGLAKRDADEVTMTADGQIIGTPAYMSPEQASGKGHSADARSDVYSIGVILFELLTRALPFRGSRRMLLLQILDEEAPRARKLNPLISRDLETICAKCLEKKPANRYATAQQLVDELQRVSRNEPILARPISGPVRAWRWSRRYPIATALLGVLSLLAFFGPIVAFRQVQLAKNAQLARQKMQQALDLANKHRDRSRLNLARNYWNMAVSQRDAFQDPVKASHYFTLAAAEFVDSPGDSRNAQLAADMLVNAELQMFEEHDAPMRGARFSESEERVLSWSADGVARIWNANTGVRLVEVKHDAQIAGAELNRDETRGLSWSEDGTVRLWDATTGETLVEIKHDAHVRVARFSRNGRHVLSVSMDGAVKCWEADSGRILVDNKHPLSPEMETLLSLPQASRSRLFAENSFDDRLTSAMFDPREEHVLSFGRDLTIWEIATGKLLAHVRYADRADKARPFVSSVSFSPDATRILSWGGDFNLFGRGRDVGIVRVSDARSGELLQEFEHAEFVQKASFSRDGNRILSHSRDGAIKLWDVKTGVLLTEVQHKGVLLASFGRNEREIWSWSKDGVLRLWDTDTRQILQEAEHEGGFQGVDVADDFQFMTWFDDGRLVLWDATTFDRLATIRHDRAPVGARFSKDNTRVLCWSDDHRVRIWRMTASREVARTSHERAVANLRFNHDQHRVLSWCDAGEVRLWERTSGDTIAEVTHDDAVLGATLDRTETRILSWSRDGVVRLSDVETSAVIAESRHDSAVRGACFDTEGTRVLSWSGDLRFGGRLRLWDAGSGRILLDIEHEDAIVGATLDGLQSRLLVWSESLLSGNEVRIYRLDGSLASRVKHHRRIKGARFNRDQSLVLSWDGGSRGDVRLSATETGATRVILRHGGTVNGAQIGRDEASILSWSQNGTVRLSDSRTGETLGEMNHAGAVRGAMFDRAGTRILSWGEDGIVRVWDIETGDAHERIRHDGPVTEATFSADESRILTSGDKDGLVRLWSTRTGDKLAEIEHRGVKGARFSIDETHVLSWSDRAWGNSLCVKSSRVSTDYDWPRERLLHRLECRTRTRLKGRRITFLPRREWLIMRQDNRNDRRQRAPKAGTSAPRR